MDEFAETSNLPTLINILILLVGTVLFIAGFIFFTVFSHDTCRKAYGWAHTEWERAGELCTSKVCVQGADARRVGADKRANAAETERTHPTEEQKKLKDWKKN